MKVNRYPLSVISLFAMALLSIAELTVTLEPTEASRFVYEPFSLLLTSDSDLTRPEIPNGADYGVTGLTKTETGYRIELIAHEAGTLTLPPFAVIAGDERTQTPPLRLPITAPRHADEMSLSLTFSSTNPIAGEPVKLTVNWTSSVPFTRCQNLEFLLPLLRHPDWEAYPLPPAVPEKNRIGLPVNTQRVIAHNKPNGLEFSYQLLPRHAGSYRSTARLSCALMESGRSTSQYPSYFDNHFFNLPGTNDRFERIYLSEPKQELTVQPLPNVGRSVRFSDIVGSCAAIATIKPTETVVGQPMLLTVTLTNLSFSGHIHNLPEATLGDLGPEFRITPDPMHIENTADSKAFTYIVRPLRSGLDVLPALALQVFDPQQKKYRTIRTDPLPITIEPDGEQTVYIPSKQIKPPVLLNGIRHNRKGGNPTMYSLLEFLTENGWMFWLLPPLLWLTMRPWLRRRDRCRTDPAYARSIRALRRFRRNVRTDEDLAWKTYLADRLNLHAEAITFETVEPNLKQVNPDLLQAVQDQFTADDTLRYAPPGTPAQKTAAIRRLVKQLEKAIPEKADHDRRTHCGQPGKLSIPLILFCLFPFLEGNAQPAEQLFEQATELREAKPDEAAPLFTEAALEFEEQHEFLNAGNSWFFAGETGRALAGYLAARSRRPFQRQIRESIEFIRSQRSSGFQEMEKSATVFSTVWAQFCHWAPALRFGLLTLLYLTGWTAFLTARWIGKTIPRKAWIALGLLAVIPAFSLVWSFFHPPGGVVIQPAEARLGPGYAYEKAVEGIIPEAIEFQWLEERNGWVLARLPGKTDTWLLETACIKIR